MNNDEYESDDVKQDILDLPGGEDVRITYSRSMSLDFGRYQAHFSYAANFPKEQVGNSLTAIKTYVNNTVTREVQSQIHNAPDWVSTGKE